MSELGALSSRQVLVQFGEPESGIVWSSYGQREQKDVPVLGQQDSAGPGG